MFIFVLADYFNTPFCMLKSLLPFLAVFVLKNLASQIPDRLLITDRLEQAVIFNNINIDTSAVGEFSRWFLDTNLLKQCNCFSEDDDDYMRIDTVLKPSKVVPETVIQELIDFEVDSLIGLWTIEKWELDTVSLEICKMVSFYNPVIKTTFIEQDGELIIQGYRGSSGTIKGSNQCEIPTGDHWICIGKDIIYDVPIANLTPQYNDEIQQISEYNQLRFIKTLFHKLLEGKSQFVDYHTGKPLMAKDIRACLTELDSFSCQGKEYDTLFYSPITSERGGYNTFERGNYIITKTLMDANYIRIIRFCEDWYLNTENLSLVKVVKKYAPAAYFPKKISSEELIEKDIDVWDEENCKTKYLFWVIPDEG